MKVTIQFHWAPTHPGFILDLGNEPVRVPEIGDDVIYNGVKYTVTSKQMTYDADGSLLIEYGYAL